MYLNLREDRNTMLAMEFDYELALQSILVFVIVITGGSSFRYRKFTSFGRFLDCAVFHNGQ